ncbi:MAG: hypothetical protein WHS38_04185 [Thermodesulforhabdaceae bacterium]|jgi:hypothetical protein
MKSLKEKLELWAMAVTYAERGDRETAMRFLSEMKEDRRLKEEERDYARKQVVNRKRDYRM